MLFRDDHGAGVPVSSEISDLCEISILFLLSVILFLGVKE